MTGHRFVKPFISSIAAHCVPAFVRTRLENDELLRSGLVYGSYSLKDEVFLAIDCCHGLNHATIFDVGANQGDFCSSLFNYWPRDSATFPTVYAFEPNPDHSKALAAIANLHPSLSVTFKGISSDNCTAKLYLDREGSGLASVYCRDLHHHKIAMNAEREIQLVTLDSFCSENHIDQIDYLKLDVEGHELDALMGGRRMFEERNIRSVQFEFGGCNIDSRTFVRDFHLLLVRQYGFSMYRVCPNRTLLPLSCYSEAAEIFAWQNILAVQNSIPPGWQVLA